MYCMFAARKLLREQFSSVLFVPYINGILRPQGFQRCAIHVPQRRVRLSEQGLLSAILCDTCTAVHCVLPYLGTLWFTLYVVNIRLARPAGSNQTAFPRTEKMSAPTRVRPSLVGALIFSVRGTSVWNRQAAGAQEVYTTQTYRTT